MAIPYSGNVWQGESLANLANPAWFAKLKPSKLFHLNLACVTYLVLNCTSFDFRHYLIIAAVYSSANFQMLVWTPLLMPLTPVPIDQWISCQNPSHRFLNMLYKAHHILLLAQFAIINAVLHKHESALRFLILPWHIKRFYTPLCVSQS